MSTQADKDFLTSGSKKWGEQLLQPFTPQRQAIASEMGMHWPHVDRKDFVTLTIQNEAGEDVNLLHYRQSFKDSVIAVWLCLQPSCREYEADAEAAMALAWAWAESEGISRTNSKGASALALWLTITNEVSRSIGKPEIKGDTGSDGEETGEL